VSEFMKGVRMLEPTDPGPELVFAGGRPYVRVFDSIDLFDLIHWLRKEHPELMTENETYPHYRQLKGQAAERKIAQDEKVLKNPEQYAWPGFIGDKEDAPNG